MAPTVDELKQERDGQLSYGGHVPFWQRGLGPKVTRVGRDADGQPVAECRSWGPGSGEIVFGRPDDVERWERTEAGERLAEEGESDG